MTRLSKLGFVWLVGAGPGDPELLTLKARRLIETADALVHDALSPVEVLAWARPGAELLDVGKRCGRACRPQSEINALLVRLARAGRRVVRLKGGDPLVFGRGGEELAALAAAGVPCEVVPGVTAAVAAAAAAQVPLTERGLSQAVLLATGHEAPDLPGRVTRWADYAKLDATLCIYMGRRRAAKISAELQAGGLPADTPVLLVAAAATAEQQILPATLGTMAAVAEAAAPSAPLLIIVGEVARSPGEAGPRPAGKPVARAAALALSPA
ncbi:MAG: uroporphyrinogen-III C-methyltransferase [Opitutae bacterium]|nr:uroporphyrinogen-III C-methyltransferase [Opitutae bacterium]